MIKSIVSRVLTEINFHAEKNSLKTWNNALRDNILALNSGNVKVKTLK